MATTSAGELPHGHDNESIGTGPSSTQLPIADATRLEPLLADRNVYSATANPSIANVLADRNLYSATANPSISSILDDNPEILSTHRHPAVPATGAAATPAAAEPGAASC